MGWFLITEIDIRCSVTANTNKRNEKYSLKSNEFLWPWNNESWNPFNYRKYHEFFGAYKKNSNIHRKMNSNWCVGTEFCVCVFFILYNMVSNFGLLLFKVGITSFNGLRTHRIYWAVEAIRVNWIHFGWNDVECHTRTIVLWSRPHQCFWLQPSNWLNSFDKLLITRWYLMNANEPFNMCAAC